MSTTEATSYYTSLLATSSTSTTTESSSSTELTSEDFLTLLLAEIEYQDPTEPLENAEMVSQLTGYSQLEELTSINETLSDLADDLGSSSTTNALSYLGTTVQAEGDSIVKADDEITSLTFTLGDDAESVTVNIYDSDGNIVATSSLGSMSEGSYSFTWDGLDSDGDSVDDGTYSVVMSALDSDGDSVDVTMITSGTVTGIASTSDGIELILEDGRTVGLEDVTYVTSA